MALTVAEIMNTEIYTTKPHERVAPVLRDMLTLGIGGGPVIDAEGRPIGVVSLRDLCKAGSEALIQDCMTSPPLVVRKMQPLHDAAVLMGETGYHRLIVVEEERAVGIVSSLDLIRGLVGLPARHPTAFPHYDSRTGAVWSDAQLLDFEHVEAAPSGPGVFIIIEGGANRPERVVWGEATENVRQRLIDYLSNPAFRPSVVSSWFNVQSLRFKAAQALDPDARQQVLRRVLHTALQ